MGTQTPGFRARRRKEWEPESLGRQELEELDDEDWQDYEPSRRSVTPCNA